MLNGPGFSTLVQKPEYTMLGRTYAIGYEPDLPEVLVHRPKRTVLNPAWPWAIWYPLRRTGAFGRLSAKEQGEIIREHATRGGFPANSIAEVKTIIDPTTAEA